MTNAHWIDYGVITAADLTAIFVAWVCGKGWFVKKAKQISASNWKTGHLYWLGSDLMWTWMYANGENVRRMNHGLNKAVHHATALELKDPILTRLKALQVANAKKQRLTPAEKSSVLSELDEIISQVGKLAEINQPDFSPDA